MTTPPIFQHFHLSRHGDAPLLFRGYLISEAAGRRHAGRERNRWFRIAIYRAEQDGIPAGFVVAVVYHTEWQGECDRSQAWALRQAADVAALLKSLDPIPDGIGFPFGPQYQDRQERLFADLRSQYGDLVSEVLHDPMFAVSPSQLFSSADAGTGHPYAEMDRESLREYVRTVLVEFPLTLAEASVYCDANNGGILIGPLWWSARWANIDDTPAAALSAKWGCDAESLSRRIQVASRDVQMCLAWACAQFWRTPERAAAENLRDWFVIKDSTESS